MNNNTSQAKISDNKKKFDKSKNFDKSKRRKFSDEEKKYRISIIDAMQPEKIEKFGFERSYIVFERSVNRQEKSGDLAEERGLQYLKNKNLLSENYATNRVICLGRIKIEADIIDYDNKIVYETKSRKNYDLAKSAIRDKWMVFEYDKNRSRYQDYTFKGIIVVNEASGPVVKRVYDFPNSTVNTERMKRKFDNYFNRLAELKKIQKVKKKKTV
ncbi:hypothetical protein RZE84_09140 [Mollicutes bacterium LVI A0075]|nr:hypothetical protein RZE84_09140 [Mollicutes bacterium LVI A0075]